jgi:hypothetical protein
MASGDDFLDWDANRAECRAWIERVRSPIKIVMKTKNDPFLIERWITHHMKIVGPENLIIFDNLSDNPEVLSVYRKYRDRINILRFAAPHFLVHDTHVFGDLYRSLAKSAEYFMFLDTDEHLVFFDNDKYYSDDRIVTFVMSNRNYDLFPTIWLLNVKLSPTQFICGAGSRFLAAKLACGKPLLRSDKLPIGYVNHSFQLGTGLFAPPFRTNLFLLHLAHLIPRQRISGNVDKLLAAGLVEPGESPESIARRNDMPDDTTAVYVKEIGEFLALEGQKDLGNGPLGPGCLELSPDGTIAYYGDAERKAVNGLIAEPQLAYDLVPDCYRLAPLPMHDWSSRP